MVHPLLAPFGPATVSLWYNLRFYSEIIIPDHRPLVKGRIGRCGEF